MYSVGCLWLLICGCYCAENCDALNLEKDEMSFCQKVFTIVRQEYNMRLGITWDTGPEISRKGSTVPFSVEYDKYLGDNFDNIKFQSFKTIQPKRFGVSSFHRAVLFSEDPADDQPQVVAELANTGGDSSGGNKKHEVIIICTRNVKKIIGLKKTQGSLM